MSTVMNEEVKIQCKLVTTNLLTVLGILVELITSIIKKRVILRHTLPLGNLLS